VETLRQDASLREDVQCLLTPLNRPDAGTVVRLLFDERPTRTIGKAPVFTMAGLSLTALAVSVVNPVFRPVFILFVVANFFITEKYSHGLYAYSQGLSSLVTLLRVGKRLARHPRADALAELSALQARQREIRRLLGKFRLLALVRSGTNSFTNTLTYYLNLLCLLDLVVFLGSIDSLERYGAELVLAFEDVAALDGAISVASWLESAGEHCHPVFGTGTALMFEACYHPLIGEPRANDLRIDDESVLITGTNMAGKTTFMRTIGLNVVLGQTLWICCARSARFPRMVVRSSIRRQDSLSEGRSYYLAEIEDILGFIRSAGDEPRSLILIDEIFRGTNTVERIAASAAVLNALAKRSTVLVTTHDTELQHLLAGYAMYHFRENPDLDAVFDYRLREGPSRTRNAIKLLALLRYPPALVDEARALADRLDEGGSTPPDSA
jgi:hypothetical protein